MQYVFRVCASLALVVVLFTDAPAAVLVDFGVSTTSTLSPVAAGAVNGATLDNPPVPGDPYPVPQPLNVLNLTNIASGFGTVSVQGAVTMSSGDVPNNTFRAVNRTPGAKGAGVNPGLNNNTSNDDLFRDWIAVTQLVTTTNGVITNNPSPTLTLTISGLDPGQYNWTSWHHDMDDQTGLINYTFTDALGASSGVIDGSHGVINNNNTGTPTPNFVNGRGPVVNGTGDPANNPPGTPTAFMHQFTVGGSGTVTFAMSSGYNPALSDATTNLPNSAGSLNFAVINGFEIAQAPIPEPGSLLLLGLGSVGLFLVRRRQK